jgi:hypothetical protein
MLALGLVMAAASIAGGAAEQSTVERAFEHYERIRTALAQDTTLGVADEARALAPLAGEIAGEQAAHAAAAVGEAKDIAAARERFAAMSDVLVPKFLDAGLPGVRGFICSMKGARWAQRGVSPANPYYGKSMLTCGTPITSKQGA